MEKFVNEITSVERKDIGLKFFFENIQNYIVAATVMASGFYIFKNGSTNHIPYIGNISGIVLVLFGFTLYMLNFMHGVRATITFKLNMALYLAINLIIFVSFTDFLWSLIKIQFLK